MERTTHRRGDTLTIHDAKIIDLPRILDPRGSLTAIESGQHVPFEIRRVYYLYDVPGGGVRGGHAHRKLQQVIIALSGSFTIDLDDGREKKSVVLNRSFLGLYVPTMIWRELHDFSSGSVCLVLASEHYEEGDYYREYNEFVDASHRLRKSTE